MRRLPFLLLLLGLTGCTEPLCRNEVVQVAEAPDGRHKAVLFQRDCGAATGFSSQVSILAAKQTLSGSGNAFIADGDRGAAEETPWGGPLVELEWLSAAELRVTYDGRARVFKRKPDVKGVRVVYRTPGAR